MRFFLVAMTATALVCILSSGRRMDCVAEKNFPLTCALCSDEASALCNSDDALKAIAGAKRKALQNAGAGENAAEPILWKESEIKAAASRLAALCTPDNVLGAIVDALREDGAYYLYMVSPTRSSSLRLSPRMLKGLTERSRHTRLDANASIRA